MPRDIHITTDQPQTTRVWVKEGKAMSIAYRDDATTTARIRVTVESLK